MHSHSQSIFLFVILSSFFAFLFFLSHGFFFQVCNCEVKIEATVF